MLRVPGIGTIHGFCTRSQVSAICAGVAFFLSAKPFQHFNERPICCEVLGRKAIESRSEVRFCVELRASINLPCQIAHSNRAPRDEADSQLLAGRKHAAPFWLSFHERVFGLNHATG